ncbi:MAG: hypothetical protein OXF33_10625 [Rhodospirillales bacterium]|nr:hypothetical protein [Rhodospirillales bacterium]
MGDTTADYAHLADARLIEAADMIGSLIAVALTGAAPRHSSGSSWWLPPFIKACASRGRHHPPSSRRRGRFPQRLRSAKAGPAG